MESVTSIVTAIIFPPATAICNAVRVTTYKDRIEKFHVRYIVELCDSGTCPVNQYIRTRKVRIIDAIIEQIFKRDGESKTTSFAIPAISFARSECLKWAMGLN